MKTPVKIILSILLFIIGFFFLGVPMPYFFGRILLRIGLFGAAIVGIVAIWKSRKVEGEGDIFKNKDKLNKD